MKILLLTIVIPFYLFSAEKSDIKIKPAVPGTFSNTIKPFLERYCTECHDEDVQKGNFSLHKLDDVNKINLQHWKSVLEQVSLREMPPIKKKKQPSLHEIHTFRQWAISRLSNVLKDSGGYHDQSLPIKGNHIDHQFLFGNIDLDREPPSSPKRIWRAHPHAYLTKLNEMVHKMPKYNPRFPGQLAKGDAVVISKILGDAGDLRLSLGSDHIVAIRSGTGWSDKLPSVRPAFSMINKSGFQNYASLYKISSQEIQLLADGAKKILKYMILGRPDVPDSRRLNPKTYVLKMRIPCPEDKTKSIANQNSYLYIKGFKRKYTPFKDIMDSEGLPTNEQLVKVISFLFFNLTGREPLEQEISEYSELIKQKISSLGKVNGLIVGCTPIFLHPEALSHYEFGAGKADEYGRKRLSSSELKIAIASALTYLAPDQKLKEAKLLSKDDIAFQVGRIINDNSIRKPKILRFFQEYFDYYKAPNICKDVDALKKAGFFENTNFLNLKLNLMVAETDRLIELILEKDKDVFYELLTTNKAVLKAKSSIKGEKPFFAYNDIFTRHFYYSTVEKKLPKRIGAISKTGIKDLKRPIFTREHWAATCYTGPSASELKYFPENERCGILTQPSWLIAHSDAMDNHAIHRGIWVRERLLGGGIPEVPITVDAQLPDEPEKTLRHRMRVTQEKECWRCHKKVDPIGLSFEMFNHLGKVRKFKNGSYEDEYGNKVDTSGEIVESGIENLDGKFGNAIQMIRKLARSKHVEQVFVRHAFRYWMGRNETIHDAPTLKAAYTAYKNNGGSMNALITSLLTSDSFLYRKTIKK